ncbi:MAG TPA: hypothetical protein VHB79_39675 [Polyangiaceae bacterium]|nr:hypothetical protein [Polyangiaceae bacterium]
MSIGSRSQPSRRGHTHRSRAAGWCATAFSVLLAGCANGPLCEDLGSCGGDPNGTWVSGDDQAPACLEHPFYSSTTVTAPGAPFDSTLIDRPSPVAGQSQGAATLADWCAELVLTREKVESRSFLFRDPQVSNVSFQYDAATMSYTASIARRTRFGQYFSMTCLTQFGVDPGDCSATQAAIRRADPDGLRAGTASCEAAAGGCSCSFAAGGASAQLSGPPLLCKMVELVLNTEAVDETFQAVGCAPNTERGGCDCAYDVAYPTIEVGVYEVSGNVITHHPQNTNIDQPSQATFCQSGDSFQLSGFDNGFVLNKPPIRTVRLHRQLTTPAP